MPLRKVIKKKRLSKKDIVRSNGVVVKNATSKSWSPIKGYEGYYEVSSDGNVRSLPRDIIYESGKKVHLKGRIIRPSKDKDGYMLVHLYKGNDTETMKLHRLVASAFLPNPDNLPDVNHIDEDKSNNDVANLEWCSREYNVNYGKRNKKASEALTKYLFQRFTLDGEYIDTLSNEELEKLGFKQSVIWRASIGKCEVSSGYRWHRIKIEEASKFHSPKMRRDGSVVNYATSSTTWKGFERKVASFFGTKRVPLSGSNSGHNTNSDSLHPDIYIECKVREKFAVWNLFEDTAEKAKVEHKIPICALKQKGKKGWLVLIRPEDIEELAELIKAVDNG